MVAWLAGMITAVRPGGAPKQDATALLAFADGLMLQMLIGQVSREEAEELVDHQLSRVLTRSRRTGSGTRSDSSPARA